MGNASKNRKSSPKHWKRRNLANEITIKQADMMTRFITPKWLKQALQIPQVSWSELAPSIKAQLKEGLVKGQSEQPEVSVVISAWNEEKNLPRTLSTLAAQNTSYSFEIVVSDNNSTDQSAAMLEELGVRRIVAEKQGIAHARQAGLLESKGKYHLCCDQNHQHPIEHIHYWEMISIARFDHLPVR